MDWGALAQTALGGAIGLAASLIVTRAARRAASDEAVKAERQRVYAKSLHLLNSMPGLATAALPEGRDRFNAWVDDLRLVTAELALVASSSVAQRWQELDRAVARAANTDDGMRRPQTIVAPYARKIIRAMREDLGAEPLAEKALMALTLEPDYD